MFVRLEPAQANALMALTVHQPWAWAMCNANMRLENRTWRPPSFAANKQLALHAGKAWGRREKLDASALSCQLHPEHKVPLGSEGYVFGSIVAVARLVGFVDLDLRDGRGPYSFEIETSKGYAVVGGRLTPQEVESAVTNPFWKGPCGWLLADLQRLESPIPVRGQQKVWRLPSAVALDVAAQVDIA